jgi:hypothetical protein
MSAEIEITDIAWNRRASTPLEFGTVNLSDTGAVGDLTTKQGITYILNLMKGRVSLIELDFLREILDP